MAVYTRWWRKHDSAYDALGRIVTSQNAKQLVNNTFSYTVYDALGRITEAGELVPKIAIAINQFTGKFTDTATGDPVFYRWLFR